MMYILMLSVLVQWSQAGIEGILDVPNLAQATHLLGFNEPNNQLISHLYPLAVDLATATCSLNAFFPPPVSFKNANALRLEDRPC